MTARAPGLCLPGNKYFPFVTIQERGRAICKPYQIVQGGSKSAVKGGDLASVRRLDLQALQMQETWVSVWPSVLGLTGQSWLAAAQGHPSWSSRDKQLACHQEDS